MDRDEHLAQVSRRNTVSFEQALREVQEARSKDHETIALMNTALGNLMARMAALEQQLLIQKVQLTGLGPSVRD